MFIINKENYCNIIINIRICLNIKIFIYNYSKNKKKIEIIMKISKLLISNKLTIGPTIYDNI